MDPASLVALIASIVGAGTAAGALLSALSAFARKGHRPIKLKVAGAEVELDRDDPEESLRRIRKLLAEMAENPRVVLLYSLANHDFARRLADDLRAREIDVWTDRQNVHVGDNWLAKVEDAIADSQWVVAVLPSAEETSEWMGRELKAALKAEQERERHLILPVLVPGSSLPIALQDRVYADFSSDYESGLSALIDALKGRRQAV